MRQGLRRRLGIIRIRGSTLTVQIMIVFLTIVLTTAPPSAASSVLSVCAPPLLSSAPVHSPTSTPPPLDPIKLFPELAEAPAPAWLSPGMRVTYRVLSASTTEDQDGKTTGGAGLMQYDLIHLDETTAVSSAKFWMQGARGNEHTPSTVMASLGIPGAGEYWINPKILVDAEQVANEELKVGRLNTQIEGKFYQVVRFHYQTEEAEYVWMFEENSGLLVFYRHAIGKTDNAQRQTSVMSLVDRRYVRLPWSNSVKPDWVKVGSRLNYQGSYTVIVAGSPPTTLPYNVSLRAKRVADGWALYQVSARLAGQRQTAPDRASSASQLADALWLPAQAIRSLSDAVQTVIDRDPTTGVSIRVSRARAGGVTLVESGPVHQTTLSYDRQGRLTKLNHSARTDLVTTRVELTLTDQP
ncbi:MAG: hypothetical protein RMN25_14130 [Anaerolineae bacterium]|nr:hypothetical protein [Thermoflexales bacterium]MDW8408908.1 hypothetical protein [Anaerolineae bacterium]